MKDKYKVLNMMKKLVTGEEHADELKTVSSWYIGVMEDIIKQPLDETRSTAQVYARVVLSVHLYECGFSEIEIGRVLDRDHSTINHYRRMYEAAKSIPRSYETLLKLDRVFLKELNDG